MRETIPELYGYVFGHYYVTTQKPRPIVRAESLINFGVTELQDSIKSSKVTMKKCTIDTDCSKNASCTEGYCQCRSGFQAEGPNCLDIDECSNIPDICDEITNCSNTQGGWRCQLVDL